MHLMLSAGEASGDMYLTQIIEVLSRDHPVRLFGMGGAPLQALGLEPIVDGSELSVIGLIEGLRVYRRAMAKLQCLEQALQQRRPDLLIIADFPDFNLRLAERARKYGIPVLMYVSPQVWAWRAGRIPRIAARLDHLVALFPFEPQCYATTDLDVRYLGHPLVDQLAQVPPRDLCREQMQWGDEKVLCIMPGSRRSELSRLGNLFIEAARRSEFTRIVMPLAPTVDAQVLAECGVDTHAITLVPSTERYLAVRAADAVLAASGTATLEIGYLGTPMVVAYRLGAVSFRIMRRLIRVPHVALTNIVAGREISPEYLQDAATPEALSNALNALAHDASAQRKALAALREQLGEPGHFARVAALITNIVHRRTSPRAKPM